MLRRLFGIAWIFVATVAAGAPTAAVFPVQYSSNNRYLVDQNTTPFPILGRTAWFIISLSAADYHTFVDDTAARGYNSIELHVVNHDPRGNNPPFCGGGALPFIKRLDGTNWSGSLTYGNINNEAPDFTTPNELYWSFVDGLLSYCESKGILVFIFPAYVGFNGGSQGWMQEMVANGPTKMQTYGAWIATRYQSQKNIVWMMGGDMGTPPNTFSPAQTAVENALLTGLHSVAGQQSVFFSAEWSSESVSTDQTDFGAAMTLNGAYSFSGNVGHQARRGYAHSPVEPAFLLEEPYDEEGPDGNGVNPSATQPVRRFQWWGWLSSIGGYISGNGYIWPFRAAWPDHLDTQGSRDMAKLNTFVSSIQWYKLVPAGLSGMRNVIVAGGSSVNAVDYVAAAATFGGTLLVAYISPFHSGSITVDMTAMGGPSQARWFDPTSGAYSDIGTGLPNNGTRVFAPPGNNSAGDADWVLIINTPQPSDTQPPTVTLTAPVAGATVAGSVIVSATATDDVGVVGVQFQIDGVNLGAEMLSPPYTTTWNTQRVGNGTHNVRVVARDQGDNSAASSVSVTVSNAVTNSLVGAYGFNEEGGTTASDASVYGNTGTINGASWISQGRFGNALNFNGTSNWVTVSDSDSLSLNSGMTIEAWANPTAFGTWMTLALKEAPPGAFAYMLQADPLNHPTTYIMTDADGLEGVTGSQALPLNTWSFLSATYDGAILSLYVNGAPVGNTFVSGNIVSSPGPLRFGGNSIWGEYFAGAIDEVRLYNRALSLSEIQIDMNLPVGAPTPTPSPIPTTTPTPTPSSAMSIAGSVSYCSSPTAHPVPGATLTLTGSSTATVMTDAAGNYQISSILSGGYYFVTPSKPAVVPGGTGAKINTVDMVAVQRHFLQITPLIGCRLTAGDVTGEGVANTVDIIAIQRFYLGATTGIANTGKYRFSPVSRSYPGISASQSGQNYDTLVLGDVATPFIE